MSDLDKLFEHAPEGATELREHKKFSYLRWFNASGFAWDGFKWFYSEIECEYKTIATRPQPRKTVEDAVEMFPNGWPESLAAGGCADVLVFDPERNYYYCFSESWNGAAHWYEVCTREEFEACVAANESEPEWTHLTPIGDPCFIKLNEPDCEGLILIEIRNDGYELIKPEQLKPIKPTITKAEAWDMIEQVNGSPDYIKEQYNITD